MVFLEKLVLWGSYLVFPWIVLNLWLLWRYRSEMMLGAGFLLLLMLSAAFIYVRFIEPQRIIVRYEQLGQGDGVGDVRVALIADLHLGVYKDEVFLQRVVEMINTEKVDLVVIAGDLVYDPPREQMASLLVPLRNLKAPVYVVTGNHDAQIPGYVTSEEVRAALPPEVISLDNGAALFEKDGRRVQLIGLSDLMEGDFDYNWLETARKDAFNLLVTHNPDSAHEIPWQMLKEGSKIDLMVAGHTHGGQLFLPPLVYWVIPCRHPFFRGWYEVGDVPLYVTSGLGEVILPMRFLMSPEIVVMDLHL